MHLTLLTATDITCSYCLKNEKDVIKEKLDGYLTSNSERFRKIEIIYRKAENIT